MSAQVLFNSLISTSEFALVGLSFAVIFAAARFFHFSHGAVLAWAAYAAYVARVGLGIPLLISALMAVAFAALLGMALELGVYRRLRWRGATSLTLLLASTGLYTVLQNAISLAFGDDVKVLRDSEASRVILLPGGQITNAQCWIILTSLIIFVLAWLILRHTRLGKVLRAISNDPELASIAGIDVERAILFTFALGSALAGLAAVLISLDGDMRPDMGMSALMMAVVVVIVGGTGNLLGIAVGAVLVGAARNVSVIWVGTEWQDFITFIIVGAFLLLRPQGFFGHPLRTASV